MPDHQDTFKNKLSPLARLFLKPAEELLLGARNYAVEPSVRNCVHLRRKTTTAWEKQSKRKRHKKDAFLQAANIAVPEPQNGFFIISCTDDSSQTGQKKYGAAGIGANWATVEKVVMRYGVAGYDTDKPRGAYALDIEGTKRKKRHSNVIPIVALEPNWPFEGDRISQGAVSALAVRLSQIFTLGDEVFAVCAYMHEHLSLYEKLLRMTPAEYKKKQQRYLDADTDACTKCGLSVDLATYVEHKLKDEDRSKANLKYERTCICQFCGPPSETPPPGQVELCPTLERHELERLYDLVKRVTTVEGSVFAPEKLKDYAEFLLNYFEGEGEWVEDSSISYQKICRDDIQKNVEDYYDKTFIQWKNIYELQNLTPGKYIPQDIIDEQFIGKVLCELSEAYCAEHIPSPGQKEHMLCGVLIDKDIRPPPLHRTRTQMMTKAGKSARQLFGASRFHIDPAFAINILLEWLFSPEEEVHSGHATWLIVAPRKLSEALTWWRTKLEHRKQEEGVDDISEMSQVMEVEDMRALQDAIGRDGGVWLVEQKHGQVVQIPVGYAHAVVNSGRSMKIARDFVLPGQLHLCVLSYKFLWRKMLPHFTDEYVQFVRICTSRIISQMGATKKRKRAPIK